MRPVTTRHRRPELPPHHLDRPRVTQLLDARTRGPVLLVAPPGSGKSVAIREWVARRGLRVLAWTSLVEGDDVVDVAPEGSMPTGGADGGPRRALDVLHAVAAHAPPDDGRSVVVLEDYHRVTGDAVHEAVEQAVHDASFPARIVVASRADPPFPLRQWRAQGLLTELRERELRCTRAEGALLVQRLGGGVVELDRLSALADHLEGTPAAVQLLGLVLRAAPREDAVIERVRGASPPLLLEVLLDALLEGLPARQQRFLADVCVLGELEERLCDAVTGRLGSGHLLEELHREGLFLVRLAGDDGWYRLHESIADLLEAGRRAVDPRGVALVHQRAAAWYAGRGAIGPAVEHALAAGAHARALDLVLGHRDELRAAATAHELSRWLAAVPARALAADDVLRARHAFALALAGRRAPTAAPGPDAAAPARPAGTDPAATVVRAAAAIHASARGDGTWRFDDPVLRADVRRLPGDGVRAELELWQGRLDVLDDATGAPPAVEGEPPVADGASALRLEGVRAERLAVAGDVTAAASEALRVIAASRAAGSRGRADPDPWRALVRCHLEEGDLAAASTVLQHAQALARAWPSPYHHVMAATLGAEVLRSCGRPLAALHAVGRDPLQPERAEGGLAALVAASAGLAALDRGDVHAAAHHAQVAGPGSTLAARVLLARGERRDAGEVLAAMAPRTRRAAVEVALLRARAALPDGREARAAVAEAVALAGAEPLGWTFAQELELHPILQEAVEAAADAVPVPALDALGRHLRGGAPEPLTERERQVLALLPTRLSNPELAARLAVSTNTVKTHLKRIYRKLGVGTRSDAVDRARSLHLLTPT